MPKICYTSRNFRGKSLSIIEKANEIIEDFNAQGFDLTLRQLYYQFVSKDLIANSQKEYDNLGSIINDARLAGLIDWNAITDRTRGMKQNSHWDSAKDFVESVMPQFQLDKWVGQTYRPEVWIEKDALVGVVSKICRQMDVPYFSCRGYTSQSEMWAAAQRLIDWRDSGYTPVIIHLGDHDPSGIDMSRDIEDRLALFMDGDIEVRRIALNMNQVKKYNPPPNPAKLTDCRASSYIKIHGSQSWELDALDPKTISALIKKELESLREDEPFIERQDEERTHLDSLAKLAKKLQ